MRARFNPIVNPKNLVVIRRTVFVGVTLAAVVAGTALFGTAQNEATVSLASSVDHQKSGLHELTAANPERLALIAAVNAQIAAANGKVLDPAILEAAKAQTAKSQAAVSAASKMAASVSSAIAAGVAASKGALPYGINANAAKIRAVQLAPTLKDLAASDAELIKTIAALNDSANAWAAEQARAAVEKKAADDKASADAAAAEAVARSAASRNTAPRSVAPPAQSPASSGDSKMSIAQGVFARFGFSGVDYNSSLGAGHYAATDLDNQIIYVHLDRIPIGRVASACIHEYMHILQAREFGGYNQTVAHFGSILGMEQDADRRARANGATWTNYI